MDVYILVSFDSSFYLAGCRGGEYEDVAAATAATAATTPAGWMDGKEEEAAACIFNNVKRQFAV